LLKHSTPRRSWPPVPVGALVAPEGTNGGTSNAGICDGDRGNGMLVIGRDVVDDTDDIVGAAVVVVLAKVVESYPGIP